MNIYLRAIGIGTVAGMRSASAPALTSYYFVNNPSLFLDASPLKGLGQQTTSNVLKFMAAGELVADKLPFVPNRTDPGPLGARAVSGGVCAAAVFLAAGERPEVGAALGAASAVASAFLFMNLRRVLGKAMEIPDPIIASAEDGLALGIGFAVFPPRKNT